jgi:hypothetical protein
MNQSSLEDYQVDHLFLLMGGNALPNDDISLCPK